MSVRCFGLIFLGLCHHLWCYFCGEKWCVVRSVNFFFSFGCSLFWLNFSGFVSSFLLFFSCGGDGGSGSGGGGNGGG